MTLLPWRPNAPPHVKMNLISKTDLCDQYKTHRCKISNCCINGLWHHQTAHFQVPECRFVTITSCLSRLKNVFFVLYWSPNISALSKCTAVFSHAPGGNGASHCPTAVTPPAVNRWWQMGHWFWNSHDFWNPMCLLVGTAVFILIILHTNFPSAGLS